MIVVGIANVSGGRQRDYTPPDMHQDAPDGPLGGADPFLAFLKSELIPRIERDYRTSELRMLAGTSRGALLVVYSLLAEPSLFNARFAHSPALWRDDDAMVSRLEKSLSSSTPPDGFLYLSLGEEENEKMTMAFKRAVGALEAHAPASLKWHAAYTPNANHGNNASLATPLSLRVFFSDKGQSHAVAPLEAR